MLQASIESIFIFFLTIGIFLRAGPSSFIKYPLKDPLLAFAISFGILYAFGVGVTSNNFGALVRYKIPAIPMYLCALYMINYFASNKDKKLPVLDKTE